MPGDCECDGSAGKYDEETLNGLDEMNLFDAHEDQLMQLGDYYVDDRTGEILDAKLN